MALQRSQGTWKGYESGAIRNTSSGGGSKDEAEWRSLFDNPEEWLDCRSAKDDGSVNAKFPDFKKKSGEGALWLDSKGVPRWVLEKLESGAAVWQQRRELKGPRF